MYLNVAFAVDIVLKLKDMKISAEKILKNTFKDLKNLHKIYIYKFNFN